MNERIKELMEQASGGACYDREANTLFGIEIDIFAELIVRECCHALWTDECHTSDLAVEEFNRSSRKIKRHFGLE